MPTNQHDLRQNATDAEKLIWSKLRNRQLGNFKFRRQTPVSDYIVDFGCESAKVIVELDGEQHADNTEGVLMEILSTLRLGSADDRP